MNRKKNQFLWTLFYHGKIVYWYLNEHTVRALYSKSEPSGWLFNGMLYCWIIAYVTRYRGQQNNNTPSIDDWSSSIPYPTMTTMVPVWIVIFKRVSLVIFLDISHRRYSLSFETLRSGVPFVLIFLEIMIVKCIQ